MSVAERSLLLSVGTVAELLNLTVWRVALLTLDGTLPLERRGRRIGITARNVGAAIRGGAV